MLTLFPFQDLKKAAEYYEKSLDLNRFQVGGVMRTLFIHTKLLTICPSSDRLVYGSPSAVATWNCEISAKRNGPLDFASILNPT